MKTSFVIATATALLAICEGCQIVSAQSITRPSAATIYSASNLYNAGNHDARSGKPALAVLQYERALVLNPADGDVRANLRTVRESVGLPDQPANWLNRSTRLIAPNTMYWIGLLGIALAGASALAWRSQRSKRFLLATAISVGMVMTLMSIGDSVATLPTLNEAVAMQAAPASAAPVAGAEPQFNVPAAEVVQIRDKHDGFLLIRDSQNREGWVARSALSQVIPTPEARGGWNTGQERDAGRLFTNAHSALNYR